MFPDIGIGKISEHIKTEPLLDLNVGLPDLIQTHLEFVFSSDRRIIYPTLIYHDLFEHLTLVSAIQDCSFLDPRTRNIAHYIGQGSHIESFLNQIRTDIAQSSSFDELRAKVKQRYEVPLISFQFTRKSYEEPDGISLKIGELYDPSFRYFEDFNRHEFQVLEILIQKLEIITQLIFEKGSAIVDFKNEYDVLHIYLGTFFEPYLYADGFTTFWSRIKKEALNNHSALSRKKREIALVDNILDEFVNNFNLQTFIEAGVFKDILPQTQIYPKPIEC